jgi:hypothetical protein
VVLVLLAAFVAAPSGLIALGRDGAAP